MGVCRCLEVERQVDEQQQKGNAPERRRHDGQHLAVAERCAGGRDGRAADQQRFGAPETAIPFSVRLGSSRVSFVAIGNLAEREVEMVEQRETEHRVPNLQDVGLNFS